MSNPLESSRCIDIVDKSGAMKVSKIIASLAYNKITQLLVDNYFPELNSTKLFTLVYVDEDDKSFIAYCDGDMKGSYEILVDPELMSGNRYVVAGAIATQLAHISRELELDDLQKEYDLRYDFDGIYAAEVERYADYIAVLHGCRDYLMAYKKFVEEDYDTDSSDGLKLAELYLSDEALAKLVHDPVLEIDIQTIFDREIPADS